MVHIRPFNFSDADYDACVRLRNSIYSDTPTTVDIWKHNDQNRAKNLDYRFFVAENMEGQLLGMAQCAKTNAESGTFSLGMIGRKESWHNGVMVELLTWVKQAAGQVGVNGLVHKIQESDEPKLSFLKANGFKQVMRYPLSALDVKRFRPNRFRDKLEQVEQAGIRVGQLPAGWETDPEWQKQIHDFDWELMLDVPHHEPRIKGSLEDFVNNELLHPNAMPESYFVAWDGNRPVGMTCFIKRGGKTQTVSTALTGVLRSHRRMGLATALKVHSIQYAKKVGCQTILTKNEENNPMYQINVSLGFKARPAWLDMKLTV